MGFYGSTLTKVLCSSSFDNSQFNNFCKINMAVCSTWLEKELTSKLEASCIFNLIYNFNHSQILPNTSKTKCFLIHNKFTINLFHNEFTMNEKISSIIKWVG